MPFNFKTASAAERREEYNRIASQIGDDQFFTKKELNYLPEILQDGEQVLAFTSGFMNGHTWLLTLTDKRLIFLDKGLLFGLRQEIIPLSKVNAVSGETGLFFGSIYITDGAGTRKIENVWKKTVKNFTNKVQEALDALNTSSKKDSLTDDAKQSYTSKEQDRYDRLEKLAGLKEKGILTQEEFDTEKAKILNS